MGGTLVVKGLTKIHVTDTQECLMSVHCVISHLSTQPKTFHKKITGNVAARFLKRV